ncbi:hypothetical protein ABTE19_20375, partial [Acinetobacter baumannii]
QASYANKYGLDETTFKHFQQEIILSNPGSTTEQEREAHRKIKNRIIQTLIVYHQKQIETYINEEMQARDAYFIYQGLDGTFSLLPPSIEEV